MVLDKAGGRAAPTCGLTPPRNAGRRAVAWVVGLAAFCCVGWSKEKQMPRFQPVQPLFQVAVTGGFAMIGRKRT